MDDASDPATALRSHVPPGEPLLWTGRPDPAVWFTSGDLLLIPFSILWLGFVVAWEVNAIRTGDLFFSLWGVPFIVVGLYFGVGRFFYKHRRKLRTAYALTRGRVLVAEGTGSVTDLPSAQQQVALRRSRDGRHVSVTFVAPTRSPLSTVYANTGVDVPWAGVTVIGFYDVAEPETLLAALEQARTTPTD